MPAAEDERTGAVEGVRQVDRVRGDGARQQRQAREEHEERGARGEREPRPIGKRSVSGSALAEPRNTIAPRAPGDEDRADLARRSREEQRDGGRRDRERGPRGPACERSRHRDHRGRDDRGRRQLEPVHPPGVGEIDVPRPDARAP